MLQMQRNVDVAVNPINEFETSRHFCRHNKLDSQEINPVFRSFPLQNVVIAIETLY